jgi:hypothetical protein
MSHGRTVNRSLSVANACRSLTFWNHQRPTMLDLSSHLQVSDTCLLPPEMLQTKASYAGCKRTSGSSRNPLVTPHIALKQWRDTGLTSRPMISQEVSGRSNLRSPLIGTRPNEPRDPYAWDGYLQMSCLSIRLQGHDHGWHLIPLQDRTPCLTLVRAQYSSSDWYVLE